MLGWLAHAGGGGDVGASAILSGQLAAGVLENHLASKYSEANITLSGDTWVSGQTFNDARQALINGFDSAGVETTGWDAEIRDRLSVVSLTRVTDTIVSIEIPASSAYAIDSGETITVTVPASMLTGASALVASPTFAVTADTLSGTPITNDNTVTNIQSNYEIDDHTGFKVYPGELEKDGYGQFSSGKNKNPKHPQDLIKSKPSTFRGPQSAEPDDVFGTHTADEL